MSIRNSLLELLAESPRHAYEMRQEFERRTGNAWPLNMGQVSTTLDRLGRAALVEQVDGDGDVPRYALTDAGRAELASWWSSPVDRGSPERDELTIKLALAVATPGVDVGRVVQTQRTETVRAMRDLTRLKAQAARDPGDPGELAWTLVLDRLLFAAEAETRWLDHVEVRVRRAASDVAPPAPARESQRSTGAEPTGAGSTARRSGGTR